MAPGQQGQPGRLPTDLIAAGLTISRPNYIEKQSPGTGMQGNTGHLVPSASVSALASSPHLAMALLDIYCEPCPPPSLRMDE